MQLQLQDTTLGSPVASPVWPESSLEKLEKTARTPQLPGVITFSSRTSIHANLISLESILRELSNGMLHDPRQLPNTSPQVLGGGAHSPQTPCQVRTHHRPPHQLQALHLHCQPYPAHKSLVLNGAIFANHPPTLLIGKPISRNQHNISTAFYGPTWRFLRRNLISEILHPSRVKSYSRLLSQPESGDPVIMNDHLQYSMFCLLVLMCFGDKLGETQIKEIEDVHRHLLLRSNQFNILNIWQSLGKIIFRKRWQEFYDLMRDQEAVLMPLIEARRKVKQERLSKAKEDKDDDDEFMVSYGDKGILGFR